MKRQMFLIYILVMVLVGCAAQPKPTSTPLPPTAEPTSAAPVETETLHILRLDSNHEEFAWSGEISRGVVQGLNDQGYIIGENVVFEERYLDTKRNTSQEYLEQVGAETIAYIRETRPDMVIVNDDTATRLVVEPMRDDGILFVILGLNGKPEEYQLENSQYVTGVLERPHVAEMMEWIEQVFGEESRVSFLAEESITSDRMFGDGSVEETVKASSVEFAGLTLTNDYNAWQEYVRNAPETTDILFLGAYASLKRENGEAVEPLEALRWTLENSQIPVIGFWEEAVHIGTLGGPIISGYTQGYEAAIRAADILGGTPISELPFSVPPRGKLMVNRLAAERWDINIPVQLLEVSEIVES